MADDIVHIDFPQAELTQVSTYPDPNEPLVLTYSGYVDIDYSQVLSSTSASTFYTISGSLVLNGQQATSYNVQGFDPPNNGYLLTAFFPDTKEGVSLNFSYDLEQPATVGASASATYRVQGGYDDVVRYADPNQDEPVSSYAVCFVAGTLIALAEGSAAIETLAVGDLVTTAAGAIRPVRWIAHRTVLCRHHPARHHVMPVRIRAHAFGENRPARDLLVSPGHSICVDVGGEVLIPAVSLINGATVVRDDVERVTYWHIELDGHDILLAENLPCESYLEMGNRGFFAASDLVGFIADPAADAVQRTHADFCRPFHADGAIVDLVRAQMRRRLPALGWQLVEPEPWTDVALLVDGTTLRPKVRGLIACFEMPAGAQDIWLTCSTGVPREVNDSNDDRALGRCLAALTLSDGLSEPRALALDDPLLCIGFHGPQGDHRWTTGRARLPAELLAGLAGTIFLRLELSAPPIKRWTASTVDKAVEAEIDRAA